MPIYVYKNADQSTATFFSPAASSSPDIESSNIQTYHAFVAFFRQIFAYFSLCSGILQMQTEQHEWVYLNREEVLNWINSRNSITLTKANDGEIKYYLKQALKVHTVGTLQLVPKSEEMNPDLPKLEAKITELAERRNPKACFFRQAIDTYKHLGCKKDDLPIESVRLPEEILEDHHIQEVGYLKDQVPPTRADDHLTTSSFYTYEESEDQTQETYFVDFANKKLGGGVFGHGFVQEEIMVTEMPDFAEYIAQNPDPNDPSFCKIQVRNPISAFYSADGPSCGNPNPLIIREAHRTGKVNGYGNAENASFTPFEKAQKLNILAMAAPCLSDRTIHGQTALSTMHDLFNTFVAGFKLAKMDAESRNKPCLICTGFIGCGIFGNNRSVVFALQMLAAQYVGVDIKVFGYSQSQQDAKVWNNLCTEMEHQLHSLETIIQRIGALAR